MRRELPYFTIDKAYGGCQNWFTDRGMYAGGCGAITACDCSIYFDLYKGTHLYPYDLEHLSKVDFVRFGQLDMQPYLHPRYMGIDRLDLFIEGYQKYLRDHHNKSLRLLPWSGDQRLRDTAMVVQKQIDAGLPIPNLTLYHKNPAMRDFVWHWYLITGYITNLDTCMVKLVTYGQWRWVDLVTLWDTGYDRKGGLIVFDQH